MIDDDPGEIKDPDTDYQIDSIDSGDEITISYGLYSKMNTHLNHYNLIKLKYKQRSLAWLIATFIGYSYVLSGKENLPVDNLIGVSLMSCFSVAGILFLSFLDISIYHRFIEGIFNQTKKLEKKYHIFPKTNIMMDKLLTIKNIGPAIYDGIFYVSITFVILIIGSISFFEFLKKINNAYSVLFLILSSISILIIETYIIFSSIKSGEYQLFKNRRSKKRQKI